MKYVKKANGEGFIVDATGMPIPAELFDDEIVDNEATKVTEKDVEDTMKRLGLIDKSK